MSNAADTVIEFVSGASRGEPTGASFRKLIACLGEIEDNIAMWESSGVNVHEFIDTLGRVKQQIRLSFTEDFTSPVDPRSSVMDRSDITVLRWISEKLSTTAFTANPNNFDSIRELINEATTAIREDDSLPESLRLFIVRVIRETETALDEYEVTGDFDLTEAIVRLTGAVTLATKQTKKPGIWESFSDKYLYPAAVGITATVPPSALEVVKMLAISQG